MRQRRSPVRTAGVVGVNLPTFVERAWCGRRWASTIAGVVGVNLPTFVERRRSIPRIPTAARVSSGLTSRPSLSGWSWRFSGRQLSSVVGVNLPTFVERVSRSRCSIRARRVVGVNLPTFVERLGAWRWW